MSALAFYSRDRKLTMVCVRSPGRFFAANELKCMMAHVVEAYDVKLEDGGRIPQPEVHTYNISPNRMAKVMFRRRQ